MAVIGAFALVFFLAAIIFLLIGLINPHWSLFWSKKPASRKRSSLIYGIAAPVLLIILIIAAANSSPQSSNNRPIKDVVKDTVSAHLPDSGEKVTGLEINKNAGSGGGYLAEVTIRDDSLTKVMLNSTVVDSMKELNKEKRIYGVTFFFRSALTDLKGHTSVGPSAKVSTTRKDNIDFNNINPDNLSKIVEQYNTIPAVK